MTQSPSSEQTHRLLRMIAAINLLLASPGSAVAETAIANQTFSNSNKEPKDRNMQHPYVGMWMTADGRIRQELLPNGRYDEARGNRESAYRGRYEVKGNHIEYWDDTGFTADGTFVREDELHHGGMIFFRQK